MYPYDRTNVVPIQLPDGTRALAEVTLLDATDLTAEKLPSFDDVVKVVETTSSALIGAISKANPTRATLEFGLELGVETGKLTALFVKGTASATFKIGLEWANPANT